jgi:hypothetical protein
MMSGDEPVVRGESVFRCPPPSGSSRGLSGTRVKKRKPTLFAGLNKNGPVACLPVGPGGPRKVH